MRRFHFNTIPLVGLPLHHLKLFYKRKVRWFFYQRPQRIYILPNRDGIIYLFLLGLILLAAILEHINLTYFVLAVAAGLFFTCLVFTNYNLSEIEISAVEGHSGFVGDQARISLKLLNHAKRIRYNLLLDLPSSADLEGFTSRKLPQLAPMEPLILELTVPLLQRGRYEAAQVRLSTTFPFGLFRSWSWHRIQVTYFAYPRPKGELPLPLSRNKAEPDTTGHDEGEGSFGVDFSGHRLYGPGDSFRHINWKLVAKGYKPHVKRFTGGELQMVRLDLTQLNVISDPEKRLSQISKWIRICRRYGLAFQVKLSQSEIYDSLDSEDNVRRCLERLAVWQA